MPTSPPQPSPHRAWEFMQLPALPDANSFDLPNEYPSYLETVRVWERVCKLVIEANVRLAAPPEPHRENAIESTERHGAGNTDAAPNPEVAGGDIRG